MNPPINLGIEAPLFDLAGALNGSQITSKLSDFKKKWVILVFYPADFTFVCPTEITGFEKSRQEFESLNSSIVGISVDTVDSHLAWSKELGGISFPLLSDVRGEVSRAYGVLNADDKKSFRATFIISPDGKIAYSVISPMNVGRSVNETLRVLKALQTGRLCPVDWKPGEETLDPAKKY